MPKTALPLTATWLQTGVDPNCLWCQVDIVCVQLHYSLDIHGSDVNTVSQQEKQLSPNCVRLAYLLS